ncbi:MAG: triose-phosphate isomerase [Phycisphaerae bacterium]|jgi:triosephosphate isomerase
MRRPLIAGNWKMNLNLAQARDLVGGIAAGLGSAGNAADVAVCPPTVYVYPVGEALAGGPIQLGAQNVYYEAKGAFTGEVSAAMLKDIGVRYVIIGHSERRHTIGHLEDDRMINLKVRAVRAVGLTPILCVGETLTERKAEQTLDVITFQLSAALVGVDVSTPADLVIAYEPVWAIGTGQVATPEQAQESHLHLRQHLRTIAGDVADQVRILYGGSVTPDNAPAIMAQPDVDGGLIGGASLKADSFLGIVQAAVAAHR